MYLIFIPSLTPDYWWQEKTKSPSIELCAWWSYLNDHWRDGKLLRFQKILQTKTCLNDLRFLSVLPTLSCSTATFVFNMFFSINNILQHLASSLPFPSPYWSSFLALFSSSILCFQLLPSSSAIHIYAFDSISCIVLFAKKKKTTIKSLINANSLSMHWHVPLLRETQTPDTTTNVTAWDQSREKKRPMCITGM